MNNIKAALDDSLHCQMRTIKTSQQKAIFYYGAICALAFSGQIHEAKALAIQLGVDIQKIVGQSVENG